MRLILNRANKRDNYKGRIYLRYVKRYTDIVIGVISIFLFLPIIMIVYILVFTLLGRPIFFVQERTGKDGESFNLYKFRTMLEDYDSEGLYLPDFQRMTRFGNFLRSTSLDELPELLNVIKGDMSLIGPRPLLVEYLHLYSDAQMRRHEVRPGITGLAQIHGRNMLSWRSRFHLDVYYVERVNFCLDLFILYRTFRVVFSRQNINQVGEATMDKFKGN